MAAMRRLAPGVLAVLAVLLVAVPAGAVPPKSRLLSVTALPTGWAVTYHRDSREVISSRCLSELDNLPPGEQAVHITFAEGDTRKLAEKLVSGPKAVDRLRLLDAALRGCRRVTVTNHGSRLPLKRVKVALPKIGSTSKSYAFRGTVTGVTIGADVVTFRATRCAGYVIYRTFASLNARTVVGFAREAVAKADGRYVVAPSTG